MRVIKDLANKSVNIAKSLRKKATDAENLLWKHLRRKEFLSLKFRRQEPIDNYIVDFVCFEKRIVIEVDGGQHAMQSNKDSERDKYLIENGFKVLRFWNNEVIQNTIEVLEVIRRNCLGPPSPLSPPVKGGEIRRENLLKGGKIEVYNRKGM